MKSYCPVCRRTVISRADTCHHEQDQGVSSSEFRVPEEILEEDRQVEHVTINPGDTLDLHAFSPKEVPSLLNEFIDLAQKADIGLVKIIHGKGAGILRRRVRGLLARDLRVVAFYDSRPESGGWGATLVELKPDRGNNGGAGQCN
jgi:DNA-nicking Smr family endonuclease